MNKTDMSIKAKQLLEEGVMESIFDSLREDLTKEMLATKPSQVEDREDLYMMLQGLARLELKFAWTCNQQGFDDFQRRNVEANNRRV